MHKKCIQTTLITEQDYESNIGMMKDSSENFVAHAEFQVVPYAAVMFSSYELLLKTFNWYNQTNLDAR